MFVNSHYLSKVRQRTTHRQWWKILLQPLGARNRVGKMLSYRPVRLHRLAESIPGLLKSLKILSLAWSAQHGSNPPSHPHPLYHCRNFAVFWLCHLTCSFSFLRHGRRSRLHWWAGPCTARPSLNKHICFENFCQFYRRIYLKKPRSGLSRCTIDKLLPAK